MAVESQKEEKPRKYFDKILDLFRKDRDSGVKGLLDVFDNSLPDKKGYHKVLEDKSEPSSPIKENILSENEDPTPNTIKNALNEQFFRDKLNENIQLKERNSKLEKLLLETKESFSKEKWDTLQAEWKEQKIQGLETELDKLNNRSTPSQPDIDRVRNELEKVKNRHLPSPADIDRVSKELVEVSRTNLESSENTFKEVQSMREQLNRMKASRLASTDLLENTIKEVQSMTEQLNRMKASRLPSTDLLDDTLKKSTSDQLSHREPTSRASSDLVEDTLKKSTSDQLSHREPTSRARSDLVEGQLKAFETLTDQLKNPKK